MRIYTKTGDAGQTSLANMQRVSKADPRLETYGTADELNAWVGMLRASLENYPHLALSREKLVDPQALPDIDEHLLWVQNRLFNLGASLSEAEGDWIDSEDTTQLEYWIDAMQADLTPVRAFVLPAGNELVARCHVCRTITRRLERLLVALDTMNQEQPADSLPTIGDSPKTDNHSQKEEERRFVNRLSDYFFVLSRWCGEQTHASLEIWKK